jgi:hypothetical protein
MLYQFPRYTHDYSYAVSKGNTGVYQGEEGVLNESQRVLCFWVFPGLLAILGSCMFPEATLLLSVIQEA